MTADLANWTARPVPPKTPMVGRTCRLETFTPDRVEALASAYEADADNAIWTYMPYGPFGDRQSFLDFARETYFTPDPHFHLLIRQADDAVLGVASLMRITPQHGVIEVGHISYASFAQRSIMTTEALYLFGCRVFDELGYRRFEWKCNDLNRASKRAAVRFGFTPEGVHRQLMVVKGVNRDTAWFSILDHEWPGVKAAFERWLAPANFDADGRQLSRLDTWAHRAERRPPAPA